MNEEVGERRGEKQIPHRRSPKAGDRVRDDRRGRGQRRATGFGMNRLRQGFGGRAVGVGRGGKVVKVVKTGSEA